MRNRGYVSGSDLLVGFLILMFTILAIFDAAYWKPQRDAREAENRKREQAIAEARKVNVMDRMELKAEVSSKRFTAEFYGEFNGGFQNHVRQIFIVTDTLASPSRQYLAITGCGVTELFTEEYTVREHDRTVTKVRTVEE